MTELRQREPRRHIRRHESPADLVGQRFGTMVVLSYAQEASSHHGRTYWRIKCDCGNEVDKQWAAIRDGKRCGRCTPSIHGQARRGQTTSEYTIWCAMRDRCLRPRHKDFRHYGGRGISVCDRWVNDFENFFADMGIRPSTKHSIDRINNDGNYEPGNCKWSTQFEQNNNKRPWGSAK